MNNKSIEFFLSNLFVSIEKDLKRERAIDITLFFPSCYKDKYSIACAKFYKINRAWRWRILEMENIARRDLGIASELSFDQLDT